ncbi:MAG TPA: hypothetical protein VII92_19435 [Anaerolineae bacterium]
MTDLLTRPSQLVDGRIINDLPPHIVRLARMIARDCAQPGRYVVHLTIVHGQPMQIETARIETIRRSEAEK